MHYWYNRADSCNSARPKANVAVFKPHSVAHTRINISSSILDIATKTSQNCCTSIVESIPYVLPRLFLFGSKISFSLVGLFVYGARLLGRTEKLTTTYS